MAGLETLIEKLVDAAHEPFGPASDDDSEFLEYLDIIVRAVRKTGSGGLAAEIVCAILRDEQITEAHDALL